MAQSAEIKVIDLRRLLLAVGGVALLVLTVGFATAAWQSAGRLAEPQIRRELTERTHAATRLVEGAVNNAHAQAEILAITPAIADAATRGGQRARQLGLDRLGIEELERRMVGSRSLQVSADTDRYLRELVEQSVFAEVFVTDRNGFVVASSGLTSDFVQRDEEWWQTAYTGAVHLSEIELDESTSSVAMSVSLPVPGRDGQPAGVMKAVFDMGQVSANLMNLTRAREYVQVIDARGLIIADTHTEDLLTAYPGSEGLTSGRISSATSEDGRPVVGMTSSALDGRWSVVFWVPREDAYGLLNAARRAIVIGTIIAVVIGLLGMISAGAWVFREVTLPVKSVASAADRVREGDLRIQISKVGSGEVARLCVAVQAMIDRLRDLVTSIREASFHTRSRSHEIASAVEQLSAGTEEMTSTLTHLTEGAANHSDKIQNISSQMSALGAVARKLAQGAEEATRRSRELRELSEANRTRLSDGRKQVEHMTERASLATSKLLDFMDASRQFGDFVDLIQQFARRTNLLALNAAIEAARAGGEARGFAVLADEIRKLATQAGEAADRAQYTTNEVLGQLEGAQAAISETQEATQAIGSVVDSMDEEFTHVARAMRESEEWANRVAEVSATVDTSVSMTAEDLGGVAEAFSDFAAAMQELAAGMQEQSASTEEIAAAVNALNIAAAELASYAERFTVDDLPVFDDNARKEKRGEVRDYQGSEADSQIQEETAAAIQAASSG